MAAERMHRAMPAAASARFKPVRPQFSADPPVDAPPIIHSFGNVQVVQRSPVFPDWSCNSLKVESKITEGVQTALRLVRRAVAALANPQDVAGPLRRIFQIDVDQPGHVALFIPALRGNLEKIQAALEAPVKTYCETGAPARGKRGWTEADPKTGRAIPELGITYNRKTLTGITLPWQFINTIIHEYAHLTHVALEDYKKVAGLTMAEALDNAESYMRFVRDASRARAVAESPPPPVP